MNNNNVMTLAVKDLNCFAREITHEGKVHKVLSAGVGDTFEQAARLRSLLRSLIMDYDDVSVDKLNEIGFSKEDASEIGMGIEGLTNINIPPREEWNE